MQSTFSGYKDSAKEQYDRTYESKLGQGENWSAPKSAVGNALTSAVANTTAGWLNAAGTALKSNRKSGLAVDSGAVPAKTTGNEWYNRAGKYLQSEADKVQQISADAYTRGSQNLNNTQKLLYDVGIAGTQMISDLALGTLTGGSATIPMAIRSFGSGAMEARQAGASENQQIFYGAANAVVEAATEKMFDGVARIYGKGAADDMVDALAKRWAKSEGGQALIRGAAGMGGEGLEEMVSAVANPALKTIYNGKRLRENYSDLDLNEVVYEGMIGALLGNFGGAVDIARTARGNAQNGRLGSGGTLGEKKLTTPYADALRNADWNALWTDTGSSAKLSTPYADALSRAGISLSNSSTVSKTQLSTPYADALTQVMQQQQQGSAPGSDIISRNDAAGEQIISYAEAARRLQAEEEAIQTAASEYARYKELDRKYLNGNLKAEEFEELRVLDDIWGQYDEASERAKANGTSEHDRYLELDRKFRNGNITEQELHEWIELENILDQSDAANKYVSNDLKLRAGIQKSEAEAWHESLQNKGNIATLMSKIDNREISTRIRPQVQGKHIEGTKQFDEYLEIRKARGQMPQSILTISEQEAQGLVDKYRGTGDVVIQKSGENSLKICEFCEADRIVGKWYGENRFHETKRFEIFYSKKGTHVVPVKEIYND